MSTTSLYQHCPMGEFVDVLREGQDPSPAQTMDLSDTLMRIRFPEPLDRGTPVHLGLHFSKSDASTHNLEVSGEVLDHYREPDGDSWQLGIKLTFENEAQERNVLSYLSSCEGLY